jgi:dynein-related subfamily AAA family protein
MSSPIKTYSVPEVVDALNLSLETARPLFIEGPVGIGKSDIVKQVALKNGYEIVVVALTLKDPTDLKGLPTFDEVTVDGQTFKITKWLPPSYFPRDNKKVVIFFDEINLAPPATQHAAYSLIRDRILEEYHLPEQARMIAAGNRVADKTGVYKMNPALANRFLHINMGVPSIKDWTAWAWQHEVHPDIIAYLSWKPALLWNNETEELAWPTPRSWEMASDCYKKRPGQPSIVARAVGHGAATEFATFIKMRDKIPNVWDVVDEKVKIPDEDIGLYLSVLSAIAAQVISEPTAEKVNRALTWVSTQKEEYAMMFGRALFYAPPPTNETIKAILSESKIWDEQAFKVVKFVI